MNRRIAGFLTAVVPAIVVALASSPAGAAIDAETYVANLGRARRVAETGVLSPSAGRMSEVRAALALPAEVTIHGVTVAIPEDRVIAQLDGRTAGDFRRAADHLSSLERAARDTMDATPPDAGRLRRALRDAYRGVDAEEGFWARLRADILEAIAAIAQRIGRFLQNLGRFSGAATVVAWAVLFAVALAIALLLRRIGVVQDRSQRRRAEKQPEIDWHGIAEDALARGDAKGAVRALYASLLATLNRRGILRDAPSLTAGECRAAVGGSRPALYPAVERATTIFERVTYGHAPFGEDEIGAMRRAEREARAA